MRHRISKRLAATLVAAALVACAGTLMGASDRVFKITAPADGAQVQGSVIVRLLAKGYDDIAYVIFGVDQMRPHSANSLPYRYTLNTKALDNGPHMLSAWAYTHYGIVAMAKPVTIVVANAAAPQPEPRPSGPGPVIFAPPAAAPVAAPTAPEAEARGEPSGVKPEGPGAAKPAAAKPEPQPAARPIIVAAEVVAATSTTARAAPTEAVAASADEAAAPAAPAKRDTPPAVVVSPRRPHSLTITVDGAAVTCEAGPELRSGIAYGALRGIVDRIGGRLGWNHLQKRATAETAQARIVLTIGSATALVDDKPVALSGSVWLKQGRTMAPVRSCAEALGMRVAYEPRKMIVALFSPAPNREIGMLMK